MRPYDPRYLSVLGILWQLRDGEVSMTDWRRKLQQVQLLVRDIVIDHGNEHGLERAVTAANQMLIFVDPFVEHMAEIEHDEASFHAWKGLFKSAMEHFESQLSGDIESLYLYVLERKRGYAVETLLGKIEESLPEDDRTMLSDFARENMQESGACLAFHRFTGCGYHMARAVEDTARRYYELVKGQSQTINFHGELRNRTLAQIAGEFEDILKNWGKNKDDPGLLGLITPTLRNFCRIYRDPLAHADPTIITLNPNQAEVAFGHGVSAISSMLEDVRNGGGHFSKLCDWPTLIV